MSDHEIELLREIYEHWGRGDYTRADFLHPEFELQYGSDFLDVGEFSGIDDANAGWRAWLAQWSSWTSRAEEYIRFGDRVLVLIVVEGIGKSTGVQLRASSANIWEFRDGMPWRVVLYTQRETAFRELGVESP